MFAKLAVLGLAAFASASLVDLNADIDAQVGKLLDASVVAEAHVAKRHQRMQKHDRRSLIDLDVDANVSIDLGSLLDTALSIVTPLVDDVEKILDSVGDLADEAVKDAVAPILKTVVSTVEGLLNKLDGATASSLSKRAAAGSLSPKVTELFKAVASILNTTESIVQSVPIVGSLLGPILVKLNPLLSSLLTTLNNLVGGLLDTVGATLDKLLAGLSPLLSGLLGDVAGLLSSL